LLVCFGLRPACSM